MAQWGRERAIKAVCLMLTEAGWTVELENDWKWDFAENDGKRWMTVLKFKPHYGTGRDLPVWTLFENLADLVKDDFCEYGYDATDTLLDALTSTSTEK